VEGNEKEYIVRSVSWVGGGGGGGEMYERVVYKEHVLQMKSYQLYRLLLTHLPARHPTGLSSDLRLLTQLSTDPDGSTRGVKGLSPGDTVDHHCLQCLRTNNCQL